MKDKIISISCIIAYIICAILTYGQTKAQMVRDNELAYDRQVQTGVAIFCAITWPLTWTVRGIICVGDLSESLFTESLTEES